MDMPAIISGVAIGIASMKLLKALVNATLTSRACRHTNESGTNGDYHRTHIRASTVAHAKVKNIFGLTGYKPEAK
ncbi:MAG: hypothetical protein AOA65_0359 [Candidatus Bathyarchaeota archaeon BA1]|nr:MAG: hypothetical protein AOA65_0359 [Candidatus Bathyarchaeota archaeon BA1]